MGDRSTPGDEPYARGDQPHLLVVAMNPGLQRTLALSAPLSFRRHWRHIGAMPSIQIKDVPEETHAVPRQRAAAAHQSLQEYLRARLNEAASRPTLEEVLARAGGRSGGSMPMKDAVSLVRSDRARR